ncbi:MAG: DnaD domain protein [Clostridium sp.]|nr:DnaD domain protein [Clostridium sp.]MCM1444412.1 DnaD domain protein [Candidatus Amulumruptor caecigallinarius]
MKKKVILPADTYIVINKTILTEIDRKIITMLYQPIIGTIATSLFFTLWSFLDKSEILSNISTHHNLMSNMKISLDNIVDARQKLEAIGLLKTYVKVEDINNYVYELFSPMSAYEFFNNPLLNISLLNNIGVLEHKKLIEYFKIPKISLDAYENITCSFSDIFEVTNKSQEEYEDLKKINKNSVNVNSNINLDYIFELIPDEMLNKKRITKEVKLILKKLSFLYDLDEEKLNEIILVSIGDDKLIDIDLLKTNARKYYSFENSGKLPTIVYKTQPENLRKNTKEISDKSKMIYYFETTSPYNFLYVKNNNTKPTKKDLKILEYLLIEQNLNPGVVNVLIDYVLKINNNKLTESFITSISSQWVRSNIKTVEEAMSIAEKEYKVIKKYKTKKSSNTKITEKKPEWFGKNIKEDVATDEEQREFENKLKNMK